MPCSRIFCRSFASLSGSTPGRGALGFALGGGTWGLTRNSFGVPGGGSSGFEVGGLIPPFGSPPNPRTGWCTGIGDGRPADTRDVNSHTENGIATSMNTLFHHRSSTASVTCSNQRIIGTITKTAPASRTIHAKQPMRSRPPVKRRRQDEASRRADDADDREPLSMRTVGVAAVAQTLQRDDAEHDRSDTVDDECAEVRETEYAEHKRCDRQRVAAHEPLSVARGADLILRRGASEQTHRANTRRSAAVLEVVDLHPLPVLLVATR